MRVTIRAEGLLQSKAVQELALDGPHTVGEAARLLPLKRSPGLIIILNGKLAQWDTSLRDGDVIELIPALGGG